MSDLVNEVAESARQGHALDVSAEEEARAIVREVLAALRKPSDAALDSVLDVLPFSTWDEVREAHGRLLDAFAVEIDATMPPGAPYSHAGRDSGLGSVSPPSDDVLATEGAFMEVSGIHTKDEH